jgi:hypothetical protein
MKKYFSIEESKEEELNKAVNEYMTSLARAENNFLQYNDELRRELIAEEKEKIKNDYRRKLENFSSKITKEYNTLLSTINDKKFPLKNSVIDSNKLAFIGEFQNAMTVFNSEKVNYISTLKRALEDNRRDFFFSLYDLLVDSRKLSTSLKIDIDDIHDEFCKILNIVDYQMQVWGYEALMNKTKIYLNELDINPFENYELKANEKISAYLYAKFEAIDKLRK